MPVASPMTNSPGAVVSKLRLITGWSCTSSQTGACRSVSSAAMVGLICPSRSIPILTFAATNSGSSHPKSTGVEEGKVLWMLLPSGSFCEVDLACEPRSS